MEISDHDKKDLCLIYNYILEMRGMIQHDDDADAAIIRLCRRHVDNSEECGKRTRPENQLVAGDEEGSVVSVVETENPYGEK